MGIEQIITRIVDEAREETTRIRDEYAQKVKALESSWDEEKKIRQEALEEELRTIETREMDRQVITEKLEARKSILAIKRELVDQAYNAAKEEFLKISDKEYLPIMVNIVISSALTGDETILLSKKDHKSIGKELVKKANEKAKELGLNGCFELGDPCEDIEGGIVLKSDSVEIRRTVNELVLEVREKTEGSVMKALFEDTK